MERLFEKFRPDGGGDPEHHNAPEEAPSGIELGDMAGEMWVELFEPGHPVKVLRTRGVVPEEGWAVVRTEMDKKVAKGPRVLVVKIRGSDRGARKFVRQDVLAEWNP